MAVSPISEAAQHRLASGRVIIMGVLGCGAVAARHLAESGVGQIELLDEDPKALSALYRSLTELPARSSATQISCKAWRFDGHEAEKILMDTDVIIDGLSNWQDKLIASDVCMMIKKPLVHAGGSGFRFQVFTMVPARSACLRCVFPLIGIDEVPFGPVETTSLGPVIDIVGSLQALSAIKLISHFGASQGNELLKIDSLSGEFEVVRGLDPRPDCPDCGRLMRN